MEEKKLRTTEDVNNEYSELCKQLGDLHFKGLGLKSAIAMIEARVGRLDDEMKEILQAEQALKTAKVEESK